MNKKYLILFILILFLNFTSASSMQFDPGSLINITEVRCLEGINSLCSDTINCTITIINDSEDFLYVNQTMLILVNSFRGFNAGYAPNYTTQWSGAVDCENGGVREFVIEIGETKTDWETAFMIGLIGLIVLYSFTGFYIFDKDYWLMKSLFYFLSLGMLLILINSAKILAIGSKSDKIITSGYTITIICLSVMFLYLFVFLFIEIINALKEKNGVRWRF